MTIKLPQPKVTKSPPAPPPPAVPKAREWLGGVKA